VLRLSERGQTGVRHHGRQTSVMSDPSLTPKNPAEAGRSASDRSGGRSWWTARASSGVAPGFSRESILAEAPEDPSAPGGLFERLGELLDQLSQSLSTG